MLKNIYRAALGNSPAKLAIAVHFYQKHGRLPDFYKPKRFTDKIQARKLARDARFARYADKVAVKEIVASKLGPELVIPTLWHGTILPAREKLDWPVPFVMKANHASGWNTFVRSQDDLRLDKLESDFQRYISTPWENWVKEPWYNEIERRVLIEPYLGELDDYKFFVFHGRVRYVQLDVDRFTKHKRDFYSPDWQLLDFEILYPRSGLDRPRPKHLSEMIAAAEKLGAEFDFVRIDFYDLPSGLKFGEVTFTPDSGYGRVQPERMDRVLGDLW